MSQTDLSTENIVHGIYQNNLACIATSGSVFKDYYSNMDQAKLSIRSGWTVLVTIVYLIYIVGA
jgi:hypothetical protein